MNELVLRGYWGIVSGFACPLEMDKFGFSLPLKIEVGIGNIIVYFFESWL
ncbi:hypothetical protein [Sphingobacterium lumbrici]|nr:hypothetical protein [Sphingobacterium lumbrici]